MNTYRLGDSVGVLAIFLLFAIACSHSYPADSPPLVETATIVALSTPTLPPTSKQQLHPSPVITAVPPSILPKSSPTVTHGQATPAIAATPPMLGAVIEATGTVGICEFRLELANNIEERGKGLMHRTSMPLDQGMLFVFDLEDVLNFWMKNTLIPLDIVFFDRTLRVVDVQSMIPEHEIVPALLPFYTSAAPAKFALEVNAGVASNCSIKLGSTMKLNYLTN